VIPPGVNFDIFDPDARGPHEGENRERIRAAHGRDIDPGRRDLPAVIAWSRLDPKKNHRALVEAFASSPELRERANLLVITRGLDDPLRDPGGASDEERPLLDALISTVDRSNLWGGISAFGLSGQTALAALYRWGAETGGVFCLPAEYEPFGMTVVEAMAVGLPVVVTQNGGPQETTDGGRAGLLADPHDPGDIAAKLLRLLSDRQTWKAYAGKGLERARDLYNWRRTAEGYLKLAGEAARGERGGDPSFPIPEFARRPAPAGLPRLRGWEIQGGRPAG
jgi:sucrose-phosphate synthase